MKRLSPSSHVRPRDLVPGQSTGGEEVVAYRLSKLVRRGIITGRWLDCGCGDGSYAVALLERGATSVVGCDVNPDLIQAARRRWHDLDGVEWIAADAQDLPFADASFDGVLLNEVLEHIPEERRALDEVYRILRSSGYLCVFSPNRWFPFEGHGANVGRMTLRFPIPLLPWLPRRISRRVMRARNYWPTELASLIRAAGFDVCDIEFAFPLLAKFAWLPSMIIPRYRSLVPVLERTPFTRRFGMSTVICGRKATVS